MNAELVLDRGHVPVPHQSPTWTTTTSLLARRNVLKTLRSPACRTVPSSKASATRRTSHSSPRR
jgi:hypothetical protein